MIIVLDTELTCWENQWEKQEREVIEIGAVKLDLRNLKIVDKFQSFIKPKNNPQLSQYCIDLTKINQSDINKAHNFENIFNGFTKWCGSKNNHILGSWGRDDLLLMKESDENGIEWKLSKDHINIATFFREKYLEEDDRKYSLERALEFLELKFIGQPHRALNDALMTAEIMIKMAGD